MTKEKLKTVDIKGKSYVTVAERVRYFSENYPNGMITTDIISNADGTILMQSVVTPDIANPERVFTGYAQEKENGSFINKTSFIENCETSAVGRALGFMGIGCDEHIRSAEEVANAVIQQTEEKVQGPKPLTKPQNRTETPQISENTNEARFLALKKLILEKDYFGILSNYGFKSARDIKDPIIEKEIIKKMEGILNDTV